jgi:aerobic carbon-monoxide dehydrogenase large subunit
MRDAESGTLADPWREPPAVFASLPKGSRATASELDDESRETAEGI